MGCCKSKQPPSLSLSSTVIEPVHIVRPVVRNETKEIAHSHREYKKPPPTVRDFVLAAASGDMNTVEEYIKAGCPIDEPNKAGNTALLMACCRRQTAVAKILLLAGSSPNKQDKQGCTPMMMAIMTKNAEIVELLLQIGVDMTLRNSFGTTAEDIAVVNGDLKILHLLHAFGYCHNMILNSNAIHNQSKSNSSLNDLEASIDFTKQVISHSPVLSKKHAPIYKEDLIISRSLRAEELLTEVKSSTRAREEAKKKQKSSPAASRALVENETLSNKCLQDDQIKSNTNSVTNSVEETRKLQDTSFYQSHHLDDKEGRIDLAKQTMKLNTQVQPKRFIRVQ